MGIERCWRDMSTRSNQVIALRGGPAHVPLIRERESWAGSSQPGSPVCFRMGCPAREVYRVGTLFEQVFDLTLSARAPLPASTIARAVSASSTMHFRVGTLTVTP